MKQFDLQEYLKNPEQKIITRDGRTVRILCVDRISDIGPIVALVQENGNEKIYTYTKDGQFDDSQSLNDLFFDLEKKEGWVNIYTDDCGVAYSGQMIYGVYEDAETAGLSLEGYLSTAKIEWEE